MGGESGVRENPRFAWMRAQCMRGLHPESELESELVQRNFCLLAMAGRKFAARVEWIEFRRPKRRGETTVKRLRSHDDSAWMPASFHLSLV
ncbi:hypothetical protein GCM10010885_04330 [Alicyclobacillus cellulosilyticus]|uniref:Uncharacterized protein n=1 Tax=Alicyclobacillus cellulosilyticus TaxID=1003997 RepID=A0A917K2P9_9BACL|nr:hypothetical protein GCM10010885_04330 [Alicyclobacillus cellulosilyticus]